MRLFLTFERYNSLPRRLSTINVEPDTSPASTSSSFWCSCMAHARDGTETFTKILKLYLQRLCRVACKTTSVLCRSLTAYINRSIKFRFPVCQEHQLHLGIPNEHMGKWGALEVRSSASAVFHNLLAVGIHTRMWYKITPDQL